MIMNQLTILVWMIFWENIVDRSEPGFGLPPVTKCSEHKATVAYFEIC